MNRSGFDLVYVASDGRSGSTLIDLVLGNHSMIAAVGEVHRLMLYVRDGTELCTCKRPVAQCRFWLGVLDRLQQDVGATRAELLESFDPMLEKRDSSVWIRAMNAAALTLGTRETARRHRKLWPSFYQATLDSLNLYKAIRMESRAPIIVDSTKDVRRLAMLHSVGASMLTLHLVRDGRAVCASEIRRTQHSMARSACRWVIANVKLLGIVRRIPRGQRRFVRYEDFCRDPEKHGGQILSTLELDWEPGMEFLKKNSAHNIGGNPMRFDSSDALIRLDERWRTELGSRQLAIFQCIAGPLNKAFGYYR